MQDRTRSILQSIFYSQDPDEDFRNPNKPADAPFFKAQRNIHNNALISWIKEQGGEVLLKGMQQKIMADIVTLILMDDTKIENMLPLIIKKREILSQVHFVDRIFSAFIEEEKRQENIKKETGNQ